MAEPIQSHNPQISYLNKLIQLEFDAVLAYAQALENITLPDVRNHVANFRADSERHVTDLRSIVGSLGGEPVAELKSAVKRFFNDTFVEIPRLTGNEGALRAMEKNERLTASAYASILDEDLPSQARDVVQRNFDDERRHLAYLEETIDRKPWEIKTRKAG